MKSIFLLVTLIGILLEHSATTQALECFHCGHLTGIPEDELTTEVKEYISESCKLGARSEEKLAVACETLVGVDPSEEISCGKMVFNGKYNQSENDVEAVIRTCFSWPVEIKESCKDWTIDELIDLENMSPSYREVLGYWPNDTKVNICSCNKSKCNTDNPGSDSSGTVIKLSLVLSMISAVLIIL